MTDSNRTHSIFERLLRLASILVVCIAPVVGSAASDGRDLRWIPSASPDVAGYVVHVGNESGFFGAQAIVDQIDIGSDYTLVDGVAHFPLAGLISENAWLVMTAYDPQGRASLGSNEIYALVTGTCAVDADCDDHDFCNGSERCSGGSCSSGTPPVCVSEAACSVASCDPLAGCLVDPAPDGLWCDDGDAATSADVCSSGVCIGEVSPDGSSEPFYFEDFQSSPNGSDPIGWLDTAGGTFDQIADDFHVVVLADGNHVMQAAATGTNLHSHLMDGGSAGWFGYELSGRMLISESTGGIGVTLYSDYPNSDTYYRLRRYDSGTFRFAPHPDGTETCVGVTDTNVRPDPNRWYAFRFRAFPESGGTRVQAKVWEQQATEPLSWQADCLDPVVTALTAGAPGIWSMGAGEKYWDDIGVSYVSGTTEPVPVPEPECVADADCGDANACNGAERCVGGSCESGSPLVCTGSDQCSFAACDPALGCVVEPVRDGQACDDQNLCTGPDSCQAGVCRSGATLSCPAPNECQVGICDPRIGCSVENLPDGSRCDDGDPTTANDSCRVGSCSGEPVPEPECVADADCGDANACNGAERCVGGSCESGSPLVCTGSDQCSFAACDPALGCVVEPVRDGQACDDQNLCTGPDSCQAGVCRSGATLSCPAPNECQVGICDPRVGCSVENLPDGSRCDDGDPTTANDSCLVGGCGGEPVGDPGPEPGPNSGFYFEDFERYTHGEDPSGWFDTGASNSLAEDPSAFEVMRLADGNRVFGTDSPDVNIHSHYVADQSAHWTEYDYRGRMRVSSPDAGIGVTLYSDYPNSDSYYRLRRLAGSSFHLASHPDGVVSCAGSSDTGVTPVVETWYRFRFQAFGEGDGTRVRARVWAAAENEPDVWQIDCLTDGFGSFFSGSPGVWSMDEGSKYWDDLEVIALPDEPAPAPPPVDDGADEFYSEDFEGYRKGANPEGWFDTAADHALVEEPSLFKVAVQDDGNRALATSSSESDIHSHLFENGSESWSDYEYSGRMQYSRRSSAIGVTLYSGFPDTDSYYRLGLVASQRRRSGSTFELTGRPYGTDTCRGRTDSGVAPVGNVWYRFRFQAFAAGAASHLRAKVWPESGSEPADWQIDCAVDESMAIQSGRPGVWASGRGTKRWDDLEVRAIP